MAGMRWEKSQPCDTEQHPQLFPKETFTKHQQQLLGAGQVANTVIVPFASQQIPVLIPGCSNTLLRHWKVLALPAQVLQPPQHPAEMARVGTRKGLCQVS